MAFADFVPSEVARVTLFTAIVSLIFSVVVKRFANKYWIWFYWNVLKCGKGLDKQYLWMCTSTQDGCPTQLFASFEATKRMQHLASNKAQCPRCRGPYKFIGIANSEVPKDELAAHEFLLEFGTNKDSDKAQQIFEELPADVQKQIREKIDNFKNTIATISEEKQELYDPDLLLRF